MTGSIKEIGNDTVMLSLGGDITLPHACDLRNKFLETLGSKSNHVVLNIEDVSDIDLSFLQLLFSMQRTLIKMKKDFKLTGNVPEVFKQVVKDAGYNAFVDPLLKKAA